MDTELPFVDEHQVVASAPADAVWRCLTAQFSGVGGISGLGAEAFTRLLGAEPGKSSRGTFGLGSTLPGFAVTAAVPGRHLELSGRHRFSRYRLAVTLEREAEGTVVTALTHADFPGPHGFVYRQLVIGSGAHSLIVGRMLRDIARRAEAIAPR